MALVNSHERIVKNIADATQVAEDVCLYINDNHDGNFTAAPHWKVSGAKGSMIEFQIMCATDVGRGLIDLVSELATKTNGTLAIKGGNLNVTWY